MGMGKRTVQKLMINCRAVSDGMPDTRIVCYLLPPVVSAKDASTGGLTMISQACLHSPSCELVNVKLYNGRLYFRDEP